jgi:hypothetical protein
LWCTFEEISVDHRLIEVPQLKFLESSTMSTVNPQTWLMSAVLLVSVQAQAANDFNSSRSNRERGTLASSPASAPASAPASVPSAAAARDFNTTRNNKSRGALATPSVGDPSAQGDVEAAPPGSVPRAITKAHVPVPK